MIWGIIKRMVKARIARNMFKSKVNKSLRIYKTFRDAVEAVNSLNDWVGIQFKYDLEKCKHKSPSVVKTHTVMWSGLTPVVAHWEMYHSKSHKVYVYFPDTGERRIYNDGI